MYQVQIHMVSVMKIIPSCALGIINILAKREVWVNSLAPGRFEQKLRKVISRLISMTNGWGISCKITLRWIPLDLTDDKSTLVQVMAWCRQASSHYLSQCWPRFMSPYGVTRPQWVNSSPAIEALKVKWATSSATWTYRKYIAYDIQYIIGSCVDVGKFYHWI